MTLFNNTYQGKKVLVIGHTGFKGSWLTLWLQKLGAQVYGISSSIPTQPSMYEDLAPAIASSNIDLDIRDFAKLKKAVEEIRPDYLFHLAAQAIVFKSYENPRETIETNTMGFTNVLDILRTYPHPLTSVLITSDKCYENVEQQAGYKESDRLGGKDIYSASKAGAEIMFYAYQHSFFQKNSNLKVATTRAGNVVGGGDWAPNRIVPDLYRSWFEKKPVVMRSPRATRPWQHVLEPLSGYLCLAQKLNEGTVSSGDNFNFGPKTADDFTVFQMANSIWQKTQSAVFDMPNPIEIKEDKTLHEATLLKLDCTKAKTLLNWEANMNFDELTTLIADWYSLYYTHKEQPELMLEKTMGQISYFENCAAQRKLSWCKSE